jgi:hydrogenase expression/formation protein HypC
MCLVLPSRVVATLGSCVEVELADGQHSRVDASLKPELAIGDYVLVDRGLVVETVTAEEAEAILDMYREIGELLDAEDALA